MTGLLVVVTAFFSVSCNRTDSSAEPLETAQGTVTTTATEISPTTGQAATTVATPEPPDTSTTTRPPPAPARPEPAQAPSGGSGWLGRGDMTAESIQLHWAGYEGAELYSLFRIPRDEVDDPRNPELTDDRLIYEGPEQGHLDEGVTTGDRYYYFLAPAPPDMETPLRWTRADAVTDTTPPPELTGLLASLSGDEVLLSWDEGSDNYEFARYAIRRSENDEQSIYYGTGFSIDQTSFVDDLLPNSGSVTYEVRAVDFHGNTSGPATVVVQLP